MIKKQDNINDAVNTYFEDYFGYCDTVEDVRYERKKDFIASAIESYSDESVLAAIQLVKLARNWNVSDEVESQYRWDNYFGS